MKLEFNRLIEKKEKCLTLKLIQSLVNLVTSIIGLAYNINHCIDTIKLY